MERKPILVITDDERPYHALTLPGEEIKFIPFEGGFVPVCGLAADVILLDVNDKTASGIALLKKIKIKAPGIPVIFIAEAGPEDQGKAFRLWARDYFRKPFRHRELRRTVERLLIFKRTPERRRLSLFKDGIRFSPDPDMIASRGPGKIVHVVDYIRNNVSKDLSLDRLAREACISKYHFCKVFKKHTGMSPRQFVLLHRLERVKSLLLKDNFNISQAAIEAGFNDLCNFSKEFKRRTGLTPTAYKNIGKSDAQLSILPSSSPDDA
jgi:AraC-like DNA-binding protein